MDGWRKSPFLRWKDGWCECVRVGHNFLNNFFRRCSFCREKRKLGTKKKQLKKISLQFLTLIAIFHFSLIHRSISFPKFPSPDVPFDRNKFLPTQISWCRTHVVDKLPSDSKVCCLFTNSKPIQNIEQRLIGVQNIGRE